MVNVDYVRPMTSVKAFSVLVQIIYDILQISEEFNVAASGMHYKLLIYRLNVYDVIEFHSIIADPRPDYDHCIFVVFLIAQLLAIVLVY